MANTTNFGWETPDDTDLVKDGALAMRTLGNAIDTSLVDLKGGTTGQNLRKNSNTDMDFIWAGDATNTVIDAEGDLLVGDSADTLQRLAIGTNGQVLTVDTALDGKIKWATPAGGGGKVLQVVQGTYSTSTIISTTAYTDTGLSLAITPTANTSKILVIINQVAYAYRSAAAQGAAIKLLRGATTIFEPAPNGGYETNYSQANGSGANDFSIGTTFSFTYLDSPATTSSTTYKTQGRPYLTVNAGGVDFQTGSSVSAITLLEIGA